MIIDVYMLSGPTGSNPGGKCAIHLPGTEEIRSYIKYANGTTLRKNHPLVPESQPVYEALTAALLRRLGLSTPNDSILKGGHGNLNIHYSEEFKGQELDPNRKYFFTSKLIETPQSNNERLAIEKLKQDKLYRDLLILHDVSGRRQNVFFPHDEQKMIYLDVGCSFVDCSHGKLSQRNIVTKLKLDEKNLRKARKKLANTAVVGANGEITHLGELVASIPLTALRVHGEQFKQAQELTNFTELTYIRDVLTAHMARTADDYKTDPRILRQQTRW